MAMTAKPAAAGHLDNRTLHLTLDVRVSPRDPAAVPGSTDRALEVGEKLSLEVGLLAQRMAGCGYAVSVDRQMVVY